MATMVGGRSSSSIWMFSFKVVLLSSGALSTAVAAKLLVPSFLRFASSEVPRMYSSILSWLTPPYLYFVVNCIIISIAAASRFSNANDGVDPDASYAAPQTVKIGPYVAPAATYEVEEEAKVDPVVYEVEEEVKVAPEEYGVVEPFGEVVDVRESVDEKKLERKEDVLGAEEEEEEFVISRSSWTPANWRRSGEIPEEEKPPVSSRFGSRKSVRASPDGKALGVARPKRGETLENTWKMITDGRPIPLARHLKKSDTWEVQGRARRDPSPMKKSETFNERRTTGSSPSPGSSGGGRLRKEPSLSQDELNRRVEAFINKFNAEMRLQRQESFKHYRDMVNRGSQ